MPGGKPPPIRVAVADAHWQIVAANDVWLEGARNYGVEDYLRVGKNYSEFCTAFATETGDLGRELLVAMQSIDAGRLREFRCNYLLPAGHCGHASITVCETQGQRFAIISYFETASFERQQERGALLGMVRYFEARMAGLQEDERRRVAREFHDTAAQHLTGVSLALAHLGEIECSPQVRAITQEIAVLLDDFHRDVRGLAYVLHPPEIERSGFYGATSGLCAGLTRRTGLDIEFIFHGSGRLPLSAAETAIYRIVQEALNNIHRHAHASQVRVRVSEREDRLLLAIVDNGIGLVDSRLLCEAEPPALGVGLPGMIARARELGGHCVVRNRRAGCGTFVGAAIPQRAVGPSLPAKLGGSKTFELDAVI